MKFGFKAKQKEFNVDIDAEDIIKKQMELNEKDWKEKFDTKHNAKKELLTLKHKQKLEQEEQNRKKKNFLEKIFEERRLNKELELEEKRRIEEQERREKQNKFLLKLIASILLGIISITMFFIGIIMVSLSNNIENSPWYLLIVLGFVTGAPIFFIWVLGIEDNNNKKKRKK